MFLIDEEGNPIEVSASFTETLDMQRQLGLRKSFDESESSPESLKALREQIRKDKLGN